ncbi:recombinase family protein [Sphingobacterium sp. UT-1RO-CII-1]|uniref:recombinase family protein n=1 Tax=Sphingobacterium sp. UT-1RO-CII-1 TaxID=2995225 RepID=UPI003FA37523
MDYCSGSVKFEDRPFGKKIIHVVEKGLIEKIHVHSIDRLGRNTVDILTTIDFFNKMSLPEITIFPLRNRIRDTI